MGIFASLLRCLPGDSAPRIRLLAKFVERDYEKITRLVELRREYATRLRTAEERVAAEKKQTPKDQWEEFELDWLSRRLDAGLFSLQTIDTILAWLVAEDDGAREKIVQLLAERDESLADVKATLQEQLDGVEGDGEDAVMSRDMLTTLIGFCTTEKAKAR